MPKRLVRRSFGMLWLVAGAAVAQSTIRLGAELQVNVYTTNGQAAPSVAVDADGDFVVAWSSYLQDGSDSGVFARRFNAVGAPQGAEFQVNGHTPSEQARPEVGVRPDGDFVIVWTSYQQDGIGLGVFGRRFSSSGAGQGADFQVNVFTNQQESYPAIGVDADGDFVVAWQTFRVGALQEIVARRFDAAGTALAGEFRVNTYTTGNQLDPAVGMAPSGGFVVAWESFGQDSVSYGVFAQRFDSAGAPLSTEFAVNTVANNDQRGPRVAVGGTGDFVVVWRSFDQDESEFAVFAKRFSAAGVALAAEFQVNVHTIDHQTLPAVASEADGAFVVVWESLLQEGSLAGIFGRQFDAAGVAQSTEFQVNTVTAGNQFRAAVAADPGGDWVVSWTSAGQDGDGNGVFAQRFAAVPTTSTTPKTGELQINALTARHQRNPDVAADADGDFVVVWDHLPSDDLFDYDVMGRRVSAAGLRQATEFRVNTFTVQSQGDPHVATAAGGGFVVVWSSQQGIGLSSKVIAQRFDAAGVPLGTELQVNVHTTTNNNAPDIAMDPDGHFLVVWASFAPDGSGRGILARGFDAAGEAQAMEFQINTYTPNDQGYPAVAVEGEGGFVVAWRSDAQDGALGGIFARRVEASGFPSTPEVQVNAYTSFDQSSPAVAAAPGGDFIVSWTSLREGPGGLGVFARRLDFNGLPVGGEFQVNTYTTSAQLGATISALSSGDFVISWTSTQDGDAYGVFARRFDGAGTPLAAEFQVNLYTTGGQSHPSVAGDGVGGFVVAWDSVGQDGDQYGVFARRYATVVLLDVDGDGEVGALTDGLLVLRFLFGFTGSILISGAVGDECTRCTASAIELHLTALGTTLDIDNNADLDALTDGLLVLRFLFGFSGAALTNGAVGAGCNVRCDAATILPYLQGLV